LRLSSFFFLTLTLSGFLFFYFSQPVFRFHPPVAPGSFHFSYLCFRFFYQMFPSVIRGRVLCLLSFFPSLRSFFFCSPPLPMFHIFPSGRLREPPIFLVFSTDCVSLFPSIFPLSASSDPAPLLLALIFILPSLPPVFWMRVGVVLWCEV